MSEIYDYDYEPDPYGEEEDAKTCNRCGAQGLHWDDFGMGFMLFDDNLKRHFCNPPSADDFDIL